MPPAQDPESYWTDQDKKELERAATFEELRVIAVRILERMPQPVGMVCGPISNGGAGSPEENIKAMKAEIKKLTDQGKSIFSQLPFEPAMWRIMKTPYYRHENHLLDTFYLYLFKTGLIKILYFMANWATSFGAKWEHEQPDRFGLEKEYLD